MKNSIIKLCGLFGLRILKVANFKELQNQARLGTAMLRWSKSNIPLALKQYVLQNVERSNSQFQQDLIVEFIFENTEKGFFVEFGAADGLAGSNTYNLEMKGWNGILSEPSREFERKLRRNRKCLIDFRAVYSKSGEYVEFIQRGLLSSVSQFANDDMHGADRQKSRRIYMVETVSLEDLLSDSGAPKHIEYMSVDTEGSELEILKSFDFKSYVVDFFSVEHNYGASRQEIAKLMQNNGYVRILEEVSEADDYWIREIHFAKNSRLKELMANS